MSDETRQQRLEYTRIAPGGIGPMRTLEHYLNAESGLEAVLLELVRLRVSLMNGCAFCIGLHTHELRRHNEPDGRIAALSYWAESDGYTQRERAALHWAELLTRLEGEVPEAEFEAARRYLSDKELVDLSLAVASINAWNRLGVAFLPQWDESKAGGSKTPPSSAVETVTAPGSDRGTVSPRAETTADQPGADDEGKVTEDEADS